MPAAEPARVIPSAFPPPDPTPPWQKNAERRAYQGPRRARKCDSRSRDRRRSAHPARGDLRDSPHGSWAAAPVSVCLVASVAIFHRRAIGPVVGEARDRRRARPTTTPRRAGGREPGRTLTVAGVNRATDRSWLRYWRWAARRAEKQGTSTACGTVSRVTVGRWGARRP